MQYSRARWYDPRVGQWLSEDPLSFAALDVNLKRYVGNNSITLIDPTGLWGDGQGDGGLLDDIYPKPPPFNPHIDLPWNAVPSPMNEPPAGSQQIDVPLSAPVPYIPPIDPYDLLLPPSGDIPLIYNGGVVQSPPPAPSGPGSPLITPLPQELSPKDIGQDLIGIYIVDPIKDQFIEPLKDDVLDDLQNYWNDHLGDLLPLGDQGHSDEPEFPQYNGPGGPSGDKRDPEIKCTFGVGGINMDSLKDPKPKLNFGLDIKL